MPTSVIGGLGATERLAILFHDLPPELIPDLDRVRVADGGKLDSAGLFQANLQLGSNVCTTTVSSCVQGHPKLHFPVKPMHSSGTVGKGLAPVSGPDNSENFAAHGKLHKNASASWEKLELS